MLLLLLFFIFSVMAVQLFATVGFNGNYNVDANFRNFGTAFVTLLRFSTGENWNGFMHDLQIGPAEPNECFANLKLSPSHEDYPEGGSCYDSSSCGYVGLDRPWCNPAFEGQDGIWKDVNGPSQGKFITFGFFLVFQLSISYVFLNLFIGIILEGFDSADETKRSIKPEDFEKFSEHWAEFDPDATFYIEITVLKKFVQTLYAPWGFGEYAATKSEMKAKIAELDLKVTVDDKVHFKDVLMGLSRDAVKTEFLAQKMREHQIKLKVVHWAKSPLFHKLVRVQAVKGATFKIGHHYAAEVIQAFFLNKVLGKRKTEEEKEKAKKKEKEKEEQKEGERQETGEGGGEGERGRRKGGAAFAQSPSALEEKDTSKVSFGGSSSSIQPKSSPEKAAEEEKEEVETDETIGLSPRGKTRSDVTTPEKAAAEESNTEVAPADTIGLGPKDETRPAVATPTKKT